MNRHTICGRDELKWPLTRRFAGIFSLIRLLAGLLGEELGRTVRKALGYMGGILLPFCPAQAYIQPRDQAARCEGENQVAQPLGEEVGGQQVFTCCLDED